MTKPKKGYQGHKSWNHWNVALWIGNDEGLYRHACDAVRRYGADGAARVLAHELEGQQTPDGAPYRKTYIRAALVGILS